MHIREIHLKAFKRFADLTIRGLSDKTKLVVLVGPNGSGKSSLFEAFNLWYKANGFGNWGDEYYYLRGTSSSSYNMNRLVSEGVKIHFYENAEQLPQNSVRGRFYFRTAHRNEPDFTVKNFESVVSPIQKFQFNNLSLTDTSVSQDFQRLISSSVTALYDESNASRTAKEIKEDLIGRLQKALRNIFGGLQLENISHPFEDGTFYFTKGAIRHFRYCNLSAGEKSAFDLILDLLIKSQWYPDAIYCIDEPELHMHTELQSKLLEEMYGLIPTQGQLWIATHSIGMLARAKDLETVHPGTVSFLDFSGKDFDDKVEIEPSGADRSLGKKFLELTLGNYFNLNAPDLFVFCEGDPNGTINQCFDSRVYEKIFSNEFPSAQFISIGGCAEVSDPNNKVVGVVRQLFPTARIVRVIDRDASSAEDIAQLKRRCPELHVLSKRNLEGYFLSDEIITKYCKSMMKETMTQNVLQIRDNALTASVARHNAPDDYKSAGGEFYVQVARQFSLPNPGRTFHSFLLSSFAPLVTPETATYAQLKSEIFQ